MKRRGFSLIVMAALGTLAGCAGIDVLYPEAVASPALLASVAPRRVTVDRITDRRIDQTRIGTKPRNGDAIVTRRPVVDIVREALAVELATNGHVVVPGQGDIRIAADVEEFWLDMASREDSTQYVGRVGLALAVIDGRTGAALLMRRYAGTRRRQADADSKDARREVMDDALARTMRDIATDPDLVAALARAPATTGRRPGAAGFAGGAGDGSLLIR